MSLASKRHLPPNRNDSFLSSFLLCSFHPQRRCLPMPAWFSKPPKKCAHLTESVQNAVYRILLSMLRLKWQTHLASPAWGLSPVPFISPPSSSIIFHFNKFWTMTRWNHSWSCWMCLDNASPQFVDQGSIFSWPEKRSMALPLGPHAC